MSAPHEITVRFFAGTRDLAGTRETQLSIAEHGESIDALLGRLGERYAALAPHLARMSVALNDAMSKREATAKPGDTLDLLPPVAGGAPTLHPRVLVADVRDAPLSIDECYRAVVTKETGGVCTFVGVVRDHHEGEAVARLDYEAHDVLAPAEMRAVLADIADAHPAARLAAVHRVGALEIGDLAVVVAAASAHRAEAFAACRAAIDTIKERVPIWKHEHAPSGEAHWVNLTADERS